MYRFVALVGFVVATMLLPSLPAQAGTTCTFFPLGSTKKCCGKASADCTECKTTTIVSGTACTTCYFYGSTDVANNTKFGVNAFNPQTRFTLTGTVGCGTNLDGSINYDSDSCLVDVRVFCGPKLCESNPGHPSCPNTQASEGEPFFLEGPVTTITEDVDCAKKGNCRNFKFQAILIDEGNPQFASLCRPGHVVLSARAHEFVGRSDSCSEEFDQSDMCNGVLFQTKALCKPGLGLSAGQGYNCSGLD
jgi:hypothetical protein